MPITTFCHIGSRLLPHGRLHRFAFEKVAVILLTLSVVHVLHLRRFAVILSMLSVFQAQPVPGSKSVGRARMK